jgi:hypothetical protein
VIVVGQGAGVESVVAGRADPRDPRQRVVLGVPAGDVRERRSRRRPGVAGGAAPQRQGRPRLMADRAQRRRGHRRAPGDRMAVRAVA